MEAVAPPEPDNHPAPAPAPEIEEAPAPVPKIEETPTNAAIPEVLPIQPETSHKPASVVNQESAPSPVLEPISEIRQIEVEQEELPMVSGHPDNTETTPPAQPEHAEAIPATPEPGAPELAAEAPTEVPNGGEATQHDLVEYVSLVGAEEGNLETTGQSNGAIGATPTVQPDELPHDVIHTHSEQDTGVLAHTEEPNEREPESITSEALAQPQISLEEEDAVAEPPIHVIASEGVPTEAITMNGLPAAETDQPEQ